MGWGPYAGVMFMVKHIRSDNIAISDHNHKHNLGAPPKRQRGFICHESQDGDEASKSPEMERTNRRHKPHTCLAPAQCPFMGFFPSPLASRERSERGRKRTRDQCQTLKRASERSGRTGGTGKGGMEGGLLCNTHSQHRVILPVTPGNRASSNVCKAQWS